MSSKIHILVVEDEFINRIHLKSSLISMGYSVSEADSLDSATKALQKGEVDLAILDINLNEGDRNGIMIGDYINKNLKIPFIYLTAYGTNDIIEKAIYTEPHSYLLKPFNKVELNTSIELAINKYNLDRKKRTLKEILIKDGNFYIKLEVTDIDFVESNGNYVTIHAFNKVYRYRATIKQMLLELPEQNFTQTHRAYIVNTEKIDAFSKNNITISGNEVPLSEKFRNSFF